MPGYYLIIGINYPSENIRPIICCLQLKEPDAILKIEMVPESQARRVPYKPFRQVDGGEQITLLAINHLNHLLKTRISVIVQILGTLQTTNGWNAAQIPNFLLNKDVPEISRV